VQLPSVNYTLGIYKTFNQTTWIKHKRAAQSTWNATSDDWLSDLVNFYLLHEENPFVDLIWSQPDEVYGPTDFFRGNVARSDLHFDVYICGGAQFIGPLLAIIATFRAFRSQDILLTSAVPSLRLWHAADVLRAVDVGPIQLRQSCALFSGWSGFNFVWTVLAVGCMESILYHNTLNNTSVEKFG